MAWAEEDMRPRFFGEPWPSGMCETGLKVLTPVGLACWWCEQLIVEGDRGGFVNHESGAEPVHRECHLRSVVGGIGHLQNHDYWCAQMQDPDGGRTRRQSALEVWEWVLLHGIPT